MKCRCQPFFKNNQRPTKLCVNKSSLNSQLSTASVELCGPFILLQCKKAALSKVQISPTHTNIEGPPKKKVKPKAKPKVKSKAKKAPKKRTQA